MFSSYNVQSYKLQVFFPRLWSYTMFSLESALVVVFYLLIQQLTQVRRPMCLVITLSKPQKI